MKKAITGFTLVLALIMVMSSISISAFAASKCPDHPNAKVDKLVGSGYFAQFSDIQHVEHYGIEYECSVCHRFLYSDTGDDFSFHRFSGNDGGQCSVCGKKRATKADLKAEAWGWVSQDIDKRGGWALYSGTAYSTAGGTTKVGSVSTNQRLRIVEHTDIGGVLWFRVCDNIDTQNPIGWISSELISIDKRLIDGGGDDVYKYHTVRITVSSGRARSGAGNYPIIEYVKFDETFYVYDEKEGTDGKKWLQVKVDGKDAWISAGLVTIID